MAKYRVEISRTICQGFGACVEICPGGFSLSDDDGKSRLLEKASEEEGKEFIEVEDLGCYGQAEATCPFKAITVTVLEEA
jgi:ferredoxin